MATTYTSPSKVSWVIWGSLGALIGIPLAAAGAAILQTCSTSYDCVPEVAAPADDEPATVPEPT